MIQPATAAKPAASTSNRGLLRGTMKPRNITVKKPKKNLAYGFSTGAPVAIGNIPT